MVALFETTYSRGLLSKIIRDPGRAVIFFPTVILSSSSCYTTVAGLLLQCPICHDQNVTEFGYTLRILLPSTLYTAELFAVFTNRFTVLTGTGVEGLGTGTCVGVGVTFVFAETAAVTVTLTVPHCPPV